MVDPRIAAILEARKTLPTASPQEVHAKPANRVQALSTATEDGELVPAPAPTDDLTIEKFLTTYLPVLEADVKELFTFKSGFNLGELFRDTSALIAHVSEAVGKGLPLVKGTEARALVVAAVLWAFNTYAAPRIGPVPSFFIRSGLPLLVQFLYDTVVKPKLKGQ